MVNQPSNQEIAQLLERVAELYEVQHASPFRVRAYRHAVAEIESLEEPVAALADTVEGQRLEDIPGIGKSISAAIREYVHTGRLRLLDRLEGEVSPIDLFCTVPGIGEKLAHHIHEDLHIETLEELELAAHDGRLDNVPGLGDRRVLGIREALDTILGQSSRRHARRLRHLEEARLAREADHPAVGELLEIDAAYREQAAAGMLRLITPRRFNPEKKAWLPILHTDRGPWTYHVMFSNTARAHKLEKTHEWVVIFFERDGHENQCTVVTEHQGALKGRRVVRGRESECVRYYQE